MKHEVNCLVSFPHSGELIRSHHVSPKCGYYGGNQVIEVKKDEE
ncbi:MAG: 50S ribosomal protein L32 [Bacilli bacterium]|nr:50S ribosomal protein L32 [Bacilli bacterium]